VNKMDRVGADFGRVAEDIRNKLGANAWPVLWPLDAEEALRGQIDIINQKQIVYTDAAGVGSTWEVRDIEPAYKELADKAYADLVEQVSNVDDILGEMFLEEKPITKEDLKRAIRRATIAIKFIPMAGGSAFKNKGVQYLLDAVMDYLPGPLDIDPAKGQHPDDPEQVVEAAPNDNGKFCALAFKLWSDKFGRLAFFRVYSGSISKGDQIYNPRTRRRERVGRIIQIQAAVHKDIETVYSGDIAALVGIKDVRTGDTLCNEDLEIMLEPPTFPEPVISMAIEPKTKGDQEKMALSLQRLSEEDPTFLVKTDEETGQTIISGMGELHLEILRDRMLREHKVETDAGKPQIAYRESLTQEAPGEGKLVKQSGGRGQYGHVVLRVFPAERGKGLTTENKVVGGNIPKEYIKACMDGIKEATLNGIIAGYPVVDLHVDLLDGSYHEVDSNENAFRMAAIFAMKKAFNAARCQLLEPIMKVEVETPEDYQGDIMGDLNRRRGRIGGMESRQKTTVLRADVPLSEMFGYSTTVRTLSSGRASYSMEPSHFDPVPNNIVETIVAERGGKGKYSGE
jgi:elongation factor G